MEWSDRIRAALTRDARAADPDVVEELAQHADAAYAAARAEGASRQEAEAHVVALVERWSVEGPALRHRRRRPAAVIPPAVESRWGTGLLQDARYALRLAARQPRQAALAVLTLALGIGAASLLSTVAYAVLLKPLPWPNADRVVDLAETRGGHAPRFGAFTNAAYVAWRDRPATVEALAAWSSRTMTLSGAGESERVRVTAASASLFHVLGVRPLLGSVFTDADERSAVVVIADGLWRRRFGGDPHAIGARLELDGRPHTVVGVIAASAAFPDAQSAAIVPMEVPSTAGSTLAMFDAIALLRPGATAAQAAAEGTARGRFVPDTGLTTHAVFGGDGAVAVQAQGLRQALTGDVHRAVVILLVGVGLLLSTAVANVASLQLARATTRRRELAIRAALGAGTGRVTRQLLVESVLLGACGGLAGVGLAWMLTGALPALLPADFPRLDAVGLDVPVVLAALATTLGSSVLLGLLPAASVRRLSPSRVLAEGGSSTTGIGVRTGTARVRLVIMGGQVTIACLLLVGAVLLGRSFLAMLHTDRGYDPEGVLSARLSMPAGVFPAPERRRELLQQVMTRLAEVPGVSHAAFTSEIPLVAGGSTSGFRMRSATAGGAEILAQASPRIVSPEFFAVTGMRFTAGRAFSAADDASAPIAVIVNESFARQFLGPSPIGAEIPVAGYNPTDGPALGSTVVGVVEDVRYVTGSRLSQPELYYDYRQLRGGLPVQVVTLLARTPGEVSPIAAALRGIVRDADPRLVADAIQPLEQRLLATLARPRLYATVLGAFAALAMAIAAVGLFGVLSYSVSQRSRELAIRSALGAGRAAIFGLVLRQGLAVVGAGAVVGLIASSWLSRLLATQLYGVTPSDGVTFVVVPLVLLAVGVAACLTPALRAARLDPLRILRGN